MRTLHEKLETARFAKERLRKKLIEEIFSNFDDLMIDTKTLQGTIKQVRDSPHIKLTAKYEDNNLMICFTCIGTHNINVFIRLLHDIIDGLTVWFKIDGKKIPVKGNVNQFVLEAIKPGIYYLKLS